MSLPFTPISGDYVKDGCYCTIGWQLRQEGKSDDALKDCNYDVLPDCVVQSEYGARLFNLRLHEIYKTNDEGDYESAFVQSELLKKDMPKMWALFVQCFNGIPKGMYPLTDDDY